MAAARQPATYEFRRYNRWDVYGGIYLVFAGVLQPRVWADAKLRLEAFRVPAGSMEPAMLIGDYLFVDKRVSASRLRMEVWWSSSRWRSPG